MTTFNKLVVTDLVVERGGRPVVSGLSFTVSAGEALTVKGPNGAGKTSLLRAIAGFIAPTGGTVRLHRSGSSSVEESPVSEQTHVVGHLNGVKATLTVEENLAFTRAFLSRPPNDGAATTPNAVAEALDRLGLRALSAIPAGLLSAGQKRRLCLARVLVAYRPLWLLDEPTVSLDMASTNLVAGLIDEHVSNGGLAMIVTHVPLGLSATRDLVLSGPDMVATLETSGSGS
ncbi:MAG: heme ABC exporter ATP-binding protein CcmA [Hyphomicrobiaceae bacterium]|nr:heme ABC exporter ATP-binding protein CcmA [Hyphomicrobiaceae bacterium]